jgi:hypothetical protein
MRGSLTAWHKASASVRSDGAPVIRMMTSDQRARTSRANSAKCAAGQRRCGSISLALGLNSTMRWRAGSKPGISLATLSPIACLVAAGMVTGVMRISSSPITVLE